MNEGDLTDGERKLLKQAIGEGYHIKVYRHDFKSVPRERFTRLLPKLGLLTLDALSGDESQERFRTNRPSPGDSWPEPVGVLVDEDVAAVGVADTGAGVTVGVALGDEVVVQPLRATPNAIPPSRRASRRVHGEGIG